MTLSLPIRVENSEMNYSLYETWKKTEEEGQLSTSLQSLASTIRSCQKSKMPFPWDLLEDLYSGETELNEVVQFEMPVLVPAAIGILTGLLVVIVTLFFCCCRCCCGRCGAKLMFSDIHDQKRCCMYITAILMLFCISVICFTAASSYESGVKFRKGPRYLVETLDSSLDDVPRFVTEFGHDMSLLIRTELNRTLDMMHYKVGDLSNILAAPLTDIAGPAMDRIVNHIQTLQNGINDIGASSIDTNNTVENITVLSQSFQQAIDDTNNALRDLILKCASDGETFCHLLVDPVNSNLDFNTSELVDFAETMTELISEVNSVNLTEVRNLGNDSVSKLPEVINNSSRTAVSDILAELDTIPGTILPELDTALEFTNMTRSSLGVDDTIDDLKSMVDSFDSMTATLVEKTVLPVISAYKAFLACISLVGLLLGILCSKDSHYMNSRTTASHIGSKCLLGSICIAFLPTMLFLLLSSILLIVGSNLSVICGPLQDLSLMEKLDGGYLDLYKADQLADSLDVNVSLKSFVETCKGHGTIYSGLNLVETFNLSSHINISSFIPELGSDVYNEINDTIRDMNFIPELGSEVYNEINDTIRDMNVIDTSLLDNLTSSFSFENISEHSNITNTIKEELTELNLQEWSQNLTDASSFLPNGDYVNAYQSLAANLSITDTNIKIPLLAEVGKLENITNHLQNLGDTLQNSSQSISDELTNLQQFIQTQAVDSIFQAIDDFLDEMATVPVDFINSVTQKLSSEVGECGLIWDIYDALTSSVCGNFLDSLNIFWFSLYLGGFITVVLMISSCIIIRYFRKPDRLTDGRIYYDTSYNATISLDDAQAERGMNQDTNNSATIKKVLPDWSYKVIKRKYKPRRKYCFPASQSPQLMKIKLLSESLQKSHNETHANTGKIELKDEECAEKQDKVCEAAVEHDQDATTNKWSTENLLTSDGQLPEQSENTVTCECSHLDISATGNTSFVNDYLNVIIDSTIDDIVEIVDETKAVSCVSEKRSSENLNTSVQEMVTPTENQDITIDIKKATYEVQNDPSDSQLLASKELNETKRNLGTNISNNHAYDFPTSQEKMNKSENQSLVEIIQCALCKHRNKLESPVTGGTEHKLIDPLLLETEKETQKINEASHENVLHQEGNPSYVNADQAIGRIDLEIPTTKTLMDDNDASFDDLINEFNSELNKLSPPNVDREKLMSVSTNVSYITSTPKPRASFVDEKIREHDKISKNSRASLNIQVRPYSEFYKYETEALKSSETKCDENAHTFSLSEIRSENKDLNRMVESLSKLAAEALVANFSKVANTDLSGSDTGHMSATCGHGEEKTTYL